MEPKNAGFDPARRYVRVVKRRPDGFVDFTFAVGSPELFVELVLREEAFEEFRRTNRAETLEDAPDENRPEWGDDWNWTLADARETRFR